MAASLFLVLLLATNVLYSTCQWNQAAQWDQYNQWNQGIQFQPQQQSVVNQWNLNNVLQYQPPQQPSIGSGLANTMQAFGGQQRLQNLPSVQIDSRGTWYEFHESTSDAISYLAMTYTLKQTDDLANQMLRWDITMQGRHAFATFDGGNATIVINKQQGYQEGIANAAAAAQNKWESTALNSARIVSLLKTQMMANPLALLKMYANGQGQLMPANQSMIQFQPFSFCADCPPIMMQIDLMTGMPQRAQTLEGDWAIGDAVFDVEYFNWTTFGQIMFPKSIVHRLAGNVIRLEDIQNVQLMPSAANDAIFTVKQQGQWDTNYATLGYKNAQWHTRLFSMGLGDNKMAPSNVEAVMGKIYKIDPASAGYTTVIYDAPEGLYLIDPSVNNLRSEVVMKAVRDKWGAKKIAGLIMTHAHVDHMGGLRGLAAYADKVYVGRNSATQVMMWLHMKPTVLMDDLTRNPRENIDVIPVYDRLQVSSGPDAFYLYQFKTVTHANDFLAIYFPQNKVLVLVDLVNAGVAQNWNSNHPITKRDYVMRARQVLNEIAMAGIDVQTIFAIHGGIVPMADVQFVAGQALEVSG